jgi:hypothetical protein
MTSELPFAPEIVLSKPLMAQLATSSSDGARHSPVWFLWEDSAVWLIGREGDSFMRRLRADPRCAVGVVDFNAKQGRLCHVGIRGQAEVVPLDRARLRRLLSRYLGDDETAWNPWFVQNVVAPLDRMARITPTSIVTRDQSFFASGFDGREPLTAR